MTWKQLKRMVKAIKHANTAEQLKEAKLALGLAFVASIANGDEQHPDKAIMVLYALMLYPSWE